MAESVAREQRHTKNHPCDVCGGYESLPRGKGTRCSGYVSNNARFTFCSRENYAGSLDPYKGSDLYLHLRKGRCDCGTTHGEGDTPSIAPPTVLVTPPPKVYATLGEAAQEAARYARGTIADHYVYRDEAGAPVLAVFRVDLGDGKKTFRQASPEGDGWRLSTTGARLVPYHLPELRAAIDAGDTVYIVEGEKDVRAIEEAGGVATCNPMGADKDVTPYAKHFAGAKRIRIVADRDEVGRKHARAWATALRAQPVELVEPVDGKDAHDALANHALGDAFQPLDGERREPEPDTPRMMALSGVEPERVSYLMNRRIPFGCPTIGDGASGIGKSTFAYSIIAALTRGDELPDRTPHPTPGVGMNCLILTTEDTASFTIVPKLKRLGADLERVLMPSQPDADAPPDYTVGQLMLDDPKHLEQLHADIAEHSIRFVLIDPLFAYTGNVKTSNDAEMRRVLGPLAELCRSTGVAMLCYRHLTKSATYEKAILQGGGSIAIAAQARSMLYFCEDPLIPDGYLCLSSKLSFGKRADAIQYVIDADGPADPAAVAIVTGIRELEADDMAWNPEDLSNTEKIAEFLREFLAGGVVKSSKECHAALEKEFGGGVGQSVLTNACNRARVNRSQKAREFQGGNLWLIEKEQ